MDEGKYTEKCMNIINNKQRKDPTKTIKMKIQGIVIKIKNKLSLSIGISEHILNRINK